MKLFIRSLALLCVIGLTACTKVEPGYVGIVVNNYGSQKGVQDFPTAVGRVWYNPITEDVYKFPTFMQNVIWSKDTNEGSGTDESITFNSMEGATMNVDISFSYAFIPDSVPKVFVTFRKDEDHITHVYLRSILRDAFSRHASRMKAVDIFGAGKQPFLDSVKADVRAQMEHKGMLVDQISMVGAPRVDGQVAASINAVLSASQRAIEAENKVRQAMAEGEQRVAAARADSTAAVTTAAGQAEANRLLQSSTTDVILRKMALERWDGVLPQVNSGAIPFIQVTPREKKE
jgi:regulator of protease activity HflC (stomatin/prohibitin superfamily)